MPTYIVQHQLGEGLFSFLNSLERERVSGIGLIVTHPPDRNHDHLQYLVYEDELLRFVVHCDEQLIAKLVHGMVVQVRSNGKETMITPLEKITVGTLHIQLVDADHLPSEQSVSAVFLVGFIDGQIIAARNERGWDVPGGHVEPGDADLLAALRREVSEEAGVIMEGQAVPFATLQFEGNDQQMLFYTSRDCRLGEFVPSEDALERSLMPVADFITRYNWDRKVIEILISRASAALNG